MNFLDLIFWIACNCLATAWLFKKHFEQVAKAVAERREEPEAEDQPALSISKRGPWTAEDQLALKTFWASTAGQHLSEQLKFSEAHRFTDVVYGRPEESTELLRGRALGYQRLLQDLHRLATDSAYEPDLAKADAEPSAQV